MPDDTSNTVVHTVTGFTFAGSFTGSTIEEAITKLKGTLSEGVPSYFGFTAAAHCKSNVEIKISYFLNSKKCPV